jgi:hypothetical protein
LFPAPLRDLLLRLAHAGLVRARWTDTILDECFGRIRSVRPDLDEAALARTRRLMNEAVADCLVRQHEPLIAGLRLPDPDDRHVLAAAVRCGAQVIVTANLRDFPASCLAPFGIEAQHPDDFVLGAIDLAPGAVSSVVAQQAAAHRDRATSPDDAELRALETAAIAEVALPADGHVVGEPVTIRAIRYQGLPRVGLQATCQSGERMHEVSLADVVFPPGSAGAAFVARYRAWLGLDTPDGGEPPVHASRPHKVTSEDIVVGEPVELVVLASKTNALRCRLLSSTREVTLRTAVGDEIPGAIIRPRARSHL